MMKRYFLGIFLFQITFNYSDFVVQTIENRSDLNFDHAYHKHLGKNKKLPSLTDSLQKSNGRQHVVIDKKVGSDGLAIAMHDNQGHQATIFMHGQPQHSIESKRAKTKQIAEFPELSSAGSGHYAAQIMMQDASNGKMLATPKSYNHDENARFDVHISGNQGNYQVSLHPVA